LATAAQPHAGLQQCGFTQCIPSAPVLAKCWLLCSLLVDANMSHQSAATCTACSQQRLLQEQRAQGRRLISHLLERPGHPLLVKVKLLHPLHPAGQHPAGHKSRFILTSAANQEGSGAQPTQVEATGLNLSLLGWCTYAAFSAAGCNLQCALECTYAASSAWP
jgi:hypothetical protein